MTPETRQSIYDIGRVLWDAGRALAVSSHVIKRPAAEELLVIIKASLTHLEQRLREEPDVAE